MDRVTGCNGTLGRERWCEVSAVVDHWTDEVAERVLGRLLAARLAITPKRVQVTEDTDAFGDDAWRVLLVLPAPAGETWDRTAVFSARRAAVAAFDSVAAEDGRTLPGRTIAMITTDEADPADTAPAESPAAGEGQSA